MKIGVWISKDVNPQQGGGFSYTTQLINLIDDYNFDQSLEVIFISTNSNLPSFQKDVLVLNDQADKLSFFKTLLYNLSKFLFLKRIKRKLNAEKNAIRNKSIIEELRTNKIDIIFFPEQTKLAVHGYPFIVSNWDVGHLSMQAFPEVSNNDSFKRREYWYNTTIKKALAVFCESEAGKEELIHYTRLNPERIHIVPLFPGAIANINVDTADQELLLKNLNLSTRQFFFYPAQFWAHKNHFHLIEAFEMFQTKYPDVKLVLTGSDKGNQKYIFELIKEKGLTSSIFNTGFVSNEELYTMYRHSIALVMPTFLGPTNMPLLEAVALDCPVLCSDLKGHREQLGSGAGYFNPSESDSIYQAMEMMMDPSYRSNIIHEAQNQRKESIFTQQSVVKHLDQAFTEVAKYRICWK